jgi:hypothetical protein
MARSRSTQLHLECINSPEQYRIRMAGQTWISERAVRLFLAGMIGERRAQAETSGKEPWSAGKRADFYRLFDLLSPEAQRSLTSCCTTGGGSVPERVDDEARGR